MSGDPRLPSPLRALLQAPPERRQVGPFWLTRQLGRGGFAPVWLAEERYGGQPLRWAALKLFALSAGATEIGRGILDEARRLCQVEHPNVVRFYALPVDEARGVAGLAMEYVDGPSLEQALHEGGRMEVPDAIRVGAAVASALSAVHQAGIVHRDVKPANVVQAAGVYKLIDFGIAAVGDERRGPRPRRVVVDDLPLELVGSRMSELPRGTLQVVGEGADEPLLAGTVGYIDPCCLSDGAAATAASDLYGLGALLFEALTGKLPAAGAGGGLRGAVLSGSEPPPSLGAERPGLPASLVRLVDSLLSPGRAGRPPSAERVLAELERIQRDLRGRKAQPPERGPFRGLDRYEEQDRDVYFGRSTEVAAAMDRMRTRGLVALVGLSGTGKSSLARAGVLPAIEEGSLGPWPRRWSTITVTPGEHPKKTLAAALSTWAPEAEAQAPERVVEALSARVQQRNEGLVLLVDQLEELATLSDASERRWVAELLGQIAEPPTPGLRVLVTLRQDLLGALLEPSLSLGALRDVLLRGTVFVLPLTESSWGEVLDESLERYGYRLDPPELRAEILDGLREVASAMPLVQFALSRLWDRRDTQKRCIPRSALVELGGLSGALEQHAEGVLGQLAGQEDLVRDLLLSLTTAQGTRATRQPRELRALGDAPAVDRALAALRDARLVVNDEGGVTLAHEVLLTRWRRLRGWVSESQAERQQAEALEEAALAWRRAGHDDTLLLRKTRLTQAELFQAAAPARLSAGALEYIARSSASARRGRWLGATGVSVIVGLFAVMAAKYVSDIDRQRDEIAAKNQQIAEALKVAEARRRDAETNQQLAEESAHKADQARRRADELGDAFRRQLSDLEDRIDRASAAQLAKIRDEIKAKRGLVSSPTPSPPASAFRPQLQGEPPP